MLESVDQRRELSPHQIDATRHEPEQQQNGVAEAIAKRLIELGSVDLDHHAQTREPDRTVRRHHAVIEIIERFDDAGLKVERMTHRQQLPVRAPRNVRRLRIRAQREALKSFAFRRAQRHRAGIAPRIGLKLQARELGKRLFSDRETDGSIAAAKRYSCPQVITVAEDQLGLVAAYE